MLAEREYLRMRLLSKKQVCGLVVYSPAHIARLEKVGLFPKRVQLGKCRVAWLEDEILGWIEDKLRKR